MQAEALPLTFSLGKFLTGTYTLVKINYKLDIFFLQILSSRLPSIYETAKNSCIKAFLIITVLH